jgi:hypothetical protein
MTGCVAILDVWNVETFDSELRGDLGAHNDVAATLPCAA